ncbi:nucleotide cyclase [Baffinella frigidus]|nr:nucleotide cyclase [Cryptophyta sp. CCMP2293]
MSTHISASISAEELIDLINAFFSSIDKAADFINDVWKVETVGDCYIAVIGGPYPCEDHALKAVALGSCILENAMRIGYKTSVDLRVRIGIHSGDITAAFIGSALPRYLVCGEACEVVRALESQAQPGKLHLSEDTARLLRASGQDWRLTVHTGVTLPSGRWKDSCLVEMRTNHVSIRRSWLLFPGLLEFEKLFCASSLMEIFQANHPRFAESPSSRRSGGPEVSSLVLTSAIDSHSPMGLEVPAEWPLSKSPRVATMTVDSILGEDSTTSSNAL